MRRITALLLSLTMLFALAACGGPQAERPGAPSLTPETTPVPTPEASPSETPVTDGSRILVAYFSATGNTETVAGHLAETLNADTYAITPEAPYTSDDLNWRDETSRSVQEHNDPSIRPAISGGVEDMAGYDVIFLGYPLWWGDAPLIVRTFLESYDLTGKTIVPFCTSSSRGFGDSGKNLEEFAPDALWRDGERFTGSSTQDEVAEWADSLGLAADNTSVSANSGDGNILVAYFSMPETAAPNNMTQDEEQSTVVIDGEILGNTQYVATVIQEQTGADLFRIEPAEPYPTDHDTLVEQASEEQKNAARPAILGRVEDIGRYDTIYLGYPTWWSDLPMILYTFLEEYDLSGKTIVPFNTHGGSGFADTLATIADLQPQADVLEDGFTVSRNDVQEAESDIIAWLNGLGDMK